MNSSCFRLCFFSFIVFGLLLTGNVSGWAETGSSGDMAASSRNATEQNGRQAEFRSPVAGNSSEGPSSGNPALRTSSRQTPPARTGEARTEGHAVIVVQLVHVGADPVGQALALALKERFAASPLFRLGKADERKIVLRLHTVPVLSGHPRLLSAYALTWTFFENPDTLSYFLAQDCGVADSTQPDELAQALAAKTDKVAADSAYLFE